MSSSSIPATQWLVHRTLHLIASLYMHTGLYPESIEPLPQNERHLELTSSDQAENGLWLAYIYSVLWEYDMTPSTVTWEKISRDLDNQGLAVRVSTSSQNMRDYSGHLSLLLLMHDCYYYDPGLSAHPRIAWHVFLFLCSTDQSQYLMRHFCFDFWFSPFTCDIILVHFLLQLQKDTRSYEVLQSTGMRTECRGARQVSRRRSP